MSLLRQVDVTKNDLGYDAWGRLKTYQDYSILHGLWTFDIPDEIWKSGLNGVDYTSNALNPYIGSEDGKLKVSSGTTLNDVVNVSSKRHPRYQPNRGHLYSTSIIIADITKGEKDFGLFTADNGVFFRQRGSKLYAVLKSVGLEKEEEINVPAGIDLTKGNVYDIQFQWRGVGSYFFYINLELVYTIDNLGNFDDLSMANPALPAAYKSRCTTAGEDAIFYAGCVDVSSEGGLAEKQQYLSIVSEEFSASNEVVLALRITEDFLGKYNTRDSELHSLKITISKKSDLEVYFTRDPSALTGGSWVQANGGGIEKNAPSTSGTLTFDSTKAKLIDLIPCVPDVSNLAVNPSQEKMGFFLTNGDYLVLLLKGSAVTNRVVCVVGEEI